MKMVRLTDIFPDKIINEIEKIGPDHELLLALCTKHIDLINENTAQENDPRYWAYCLEYTINQGRNRR